MKQGGYSGNRNTKKGMRANVKCPICSRTYKQDWTMRTHLTGCKTFNEARKDGRK